MTCRSCIASSRAACVLGGVRLISSARIMLAKIGPAMNVNRRRPVSGSSWRMSVPVMSEGIRSGVNWMRRNDRLEILATVLTSSVLARPGTPTSRTCPRAKRPDQQLFDHVVLPDDHLADFAADLLIGLGKLLRSDQVVAASLRCFSRGHADSSFRAQAAPLANLSTHPDALFFGCQGLRDTSQSL